MLERAHTILIVDDEPANLRMLERLLRPRFTVIKATSGQEALNILRSSSLSMIITDQRMPGMSGTELLRESLAIDPNLIRIMITADFGNSTFFEAIKDGGAIRVIHKPWDPDKLMQVIVASLQKHEFVLDNQQAINRLREANELLKRVIKPPSSTL
ncbi:MAG TPA: response regulator [Blastocatellia bacterium]|nr:response regulator [Blastocatellia bacterium]